MDKDPITKEDVEHIEASAWTTYRKKVLTKAIRIISGPFKVETTEGIMTCKEGYLAVDARGYPYPIAKEEFDLIYEEVGGEK